MNRLMMLAMAGVMTVLLTGCGEHAPKQHEPAATVEQQAEPAAEAVKGQEELKAESEAKPEEMKASEEAAPTEEPKSE